MFGQPRLFGANSQPFGSTNNTGSTGAFGNVQNNNVQSGFSGFGSNNNASNAPQSGAFGANTSSLNSPFGSNNNAMGTPSNSTTSGGGLFGMQNPNTSGMAGGNSLFGMNNNGNTATTMMGGLPVGGMNAGAGTGTAIKPFQVVEEKDMTTNAINMYQSITFMNEYRNYSFEELRMQDYKAGRKFANSSATSTGFGTGQNQQFGAFGNTNSAQPGAQSSPFGQKQASGGLFGGNGVGSTSTGLFGSNQTSTNTFGANNGSTFGNNAASSGGLFGSTNNTNTNTGMFGSASNANLGGLFSQQNQTQQQQSSPFGASSGFGKPPASSGGLFGQTGANPFSSNNANTAFGQTAQQQTPNQGGLFGQSNQSQGTGLFGQSGQQQPQGGLFGQAANGNSLFGSKPQPSTGFGQQTTSAGGFGSSGGLFGGQNTQQQGGLFNQTSQTQTGGIFGQNQPPNQAGGLFSQTQNTNANSPFGMKSATPAGGLFGNNQGQQGGGIFNQNQNQQQGNTTGLFGGGQSQQTQSNTAGSLFGQKPTGFGSTAQPNTSSFGNTQSSGGLFGNKSTGGGLFGSTNTQNTTPSFGSGGTQSLLGAKPAGGLGGLGAQQPAATQTSGLFNKPATSTSFGGTSSLFGNKAGPQQGSTGGLFGSNSTSNIGAGLATSQQFSNNSANQQIGNPSQNNDQEKLQQQQLLVTNPYGTNELFSKVQQAAPGSMQVSVQIQVSATKIDADNKKKSDLISAYKHTPKPLFAAALSGKGLVAEKTNEIKNDLDKETSTRIMNNEIDANFQQIGSKLFEPDSLMFKQLLKSKGNHRNKDLKSKEKLFIANVADSNLNEADKDKAKNEIAKLNASRVVATTLASSVRETEKQEKIETDICNENAISESKLDGIDDLEFVDENYYISPSLDTLATLSKYEIQKVENLVVGNKQYGKIEFLDPVDLSDIPLGSICDDLVVFQPMSVLLYNNSTNVPEKGKGLNVRARISCYNCYPLDKSTRKPIKDPNHRIMERYSEKLKKIPHTHFESYDPASGTYCFTVDHALI